MKCPKCEQWLQSMTYGPFQCTRAWCTRRDSLHGHSYCPTHGEPVNG